MNVNAEIEQQLQSFGQLLKTRPSCTASVVEQLKTDVVQRSIQSAASLSRRRSFIGALSVAGCVLLMVGGLVFNAFVTSKAFAQVRTAVQEMQSAVIKYENKSKPELNMKIYLLKSGEFRQEYEEGLVRIFSPQEKRFMAMEAKSKTAWFSTENEGADAWDPIRRILDAEKSAVRKLGTRERDGVALAGFLLSLESDPVRVELWTDPGTHLPVELVESPSKPGDPRVLHRSSTMTFEFNKEIPGALFGMKPPGSFRLVKDGPLHPSPTPRHIDVRKILLKPGVGVGELIWGADLSAVVAMFGPPSEVRYRYTTDDGKLSSSMKPDGVSIDDFSMIYRDLGLTLKLEEDSGLFTITGEGENRNFGTNEFRGRTAEGIALGATLKEVVEAYGKPSGSRGPTESPFAVIYEDRGVVFGILDGRVAVISIMAVK